MPGGRKDKQKAVIDSHITSEYGAYASLLNLQDPTTRRNVEPELANSTYRLP